MTIGALAKQLGMTAHTLRYYEKIGLIRDVDRVGGRRAYTKADRIWMEFIQRLKATGMPLKQIKLYAELRYQGDPTITERKELLLDHKEALEHRLSELQEHLAALGRKIEIYEQMEAEYDPL